MCYVNERGGAELVFCFTHYWAQGTCYNNGLWHEEMAKRLESNIMESSITQKSGNRYNVHWPRDWNQVHV